jgi:hypothetical protein
VLVLVAVLPASARTYTYKVKHQHTLGSCQGQLVVGETEVRYEADNRKDARIWPYSNIKKIERPGLSRLVFFTFEDQTWQFGRDRPFDFLFLDGSVSDELFNFIATRVGRRESPPEVASPPGGRFEIAAKHVHFLGGCEGTLKISDTHMEYVTGGKDARLWKYLDIKRISQDSTYRLDILTYEDQSWMLGRDKVFRFELKEPLEPPVLEFIRSRLAGATPPTGE